MTIQAKVLTALGDDDTARRVQLRLHAAATSATLSDLLRGLWERTSSVVCVSDAYSATELIQDLQLIGRAASAAIRGDRRIAMICAVRASDWLDQAIEASRQFPEQSHVYLCGCFSRTSEFGAEAARSMAATLIGAFVAGRPSRMGSVDGFDRVRRRGRGATVARSAVIDVRGWVEYARELLETTLLTALFDRSLPSAASAIVADVVRDCRASIREVEGRAASQSREMTRSRYRDLVVPSLLAALVPSAASPGDLADRLGLVAREIAGDSELLRALIEEIRLVSTRWGRGERESRMDATFGDCSRREVSARVRLLCKEVDIPLLALLPRTLAPLSRRTEIGAFERDVVDVTGAVRR